MTSRTFHIERIGQADVQNLVDLRRRSIAAISTRAYTEQQLKRWAEADVSSLISGLVDNEWVWGIRQNGALSAYVACDLARQDLTLLFTEPGISPAGAGTALTHRALEMACQYGVAELKVEASLNAVDFYTFMGFEVDTAVPDFRCERANLEGCLLRRSTLTHADATQARVMKLITELNIDPLYGARHQLIVQEEAGSLQSIGDDCFGREQHMLPEAATAWKTMQEQAAIAGHTLLPVSAFRDIDYQAGIIRAKLARGQTIDEVLQVSAAPGFSEHHTGRAIDVTDGICKPLECEFETSPAFGWLVDNAGEHNFRLSYPKGNRHGIAWEPWHWFYTGEC